MKPVRFAALVFVGTSFLAGCATTGTKPLFENSNQMFMENTIRELDIAEEVRGSLANE